MDRFGETARKGFDFLKNRAKETVEVTKLSSQLRELEHRRDRSLLDIGHRVMAMYDSPSFDKEALRDRVEEVRALNAEMEAAQQSYQDVKTSLRTSVEEILPQHQEPTQEQPSTAEKAAPPEDSSPKPRVGPEAPSYEESP